EPEAHGIAERAGREPDAEAARVREGAKHARPGAELVEPLSAPFEVVALLARRVQKVRPGLRSPGADRLSDVKRLRGDLAGGVDAHQRAARSPLGRRQAR